MRRSDTFCRSGTANPARDTAFGHRHDPRLLKQRSDGGLGPEARFPPDAGVHDLSDDDAIELAVEQAVHLAHPAGADAIELPVPLGRSLGRSAQEDVVGQGDGVVEFGHRGHRTRGSAGRHEHVDVEKHQRSRE